ncbi:hypothetical protein COU37_03885 [Candidatus Micrarchaeota archaeon CG10_big_fil_rev_8_21_14_0_10_45_29]|nr:MAG: hypothetical protein COU37_03885 [Candidatus Micrarchaeota archaeon CG10_big_fil_rev_8_21_14_0_10_45_29]
MGFEDWSAVYRRHESQPVDRFKNKSRLLKAFGPNAVRVYNSFDGQKSAMQIQSELEMSPQEFSQMLGFMLENEMLSQEGNAPTPLPGEQPAYAYRQQIHGKEEEHHYSPMEKAILEQYGQSGLNVYSLIDGERTAEQILHETGISETRLVEILEFMNKKGIIKLERPATAPSHRPAEAISGGFVNSSARQPAFSPQAPPSAQGFSSASSPRHGYPSMRTPPAGISPPPMRRRAMPGKRMPTTIPNYNAKSEDDSIGFKPMVEESGSSSLPQSAFSDEMVPIDIPLIPKKLSFLKKAQLKTSLSIASRTMHAPFLDLLDNNSDFVQISIRSGIPLKTLDMFFAKLGKDGLLQFRQLDREEVRKRYGDDGLAVYKKYGRDGILIYQLIGKAESLKKIVEQSHLNVDRAADIIVFVNQMLGLEASIDRETVKKYLAQKN